MVGKNHKFVITLTRGNKKKGPMRDQAKGYSQKKKYNYQNCNFNEQIKKDNELLTMAAEEIHKKLTAFYLKSLTAQFHSWNLDSLVLSHLKRNFQPSLLIKIFQGTYSPTVSQKGTVQVCFWCLLSWEKQGCSQNKVGTSREVEEDQAPYSKKNLL